METATATDAIWFLNTPSWTCGPRTPGAEDGMSCLDSTAPRGDSPPPYVDHTEDELFDVLDGEPPPRPPA